jgi:hypothetical protein
VGRSSRGAGAVSVQVKGEEPQPKDLESDKADAAKPAPRKPARAEKRDQSEASSRDRESAQTESLHTRAIDAAKRGDCAMVRKLGEQLRKRDRAYFDGTFRRDKRLAKCYAK